MPSQAARRRAVTQVLQAHAQAPSDGGRAHAGVACGADAIPSEPSDSAAAGWLRRPRCCREAKGTATTRSAECRSSTVPARSGWSPLCGVVLIGVQSGVVGLGVDRALRIQEALDLDELDLDRRRGSVLVRRGKGGRRREVGMYDRGFEQLEPWLRAREQMPVGPLSCVIDGRTRGRAWYASAARAALRRRAAQAGVRRRFAPHQLRHELAIELAREGVPLNVIQRQLGHRNLGVTSIYLQGIDPDEIIQTVHGRRPPMIPASVELTRPRARR